MLQDLTGKTQLDCLYYWEAEHPQRVHFTQPVGDGQVVEYAWGKIVDRVRRMAAYLQSLDLPPNSQIALISKNCAHWMMTDWAIWMAGHVSVPLYPTLNADTISYILEHSESQLLFVGKLDGWQAMQPGVPESMPVVTLPLAPNTQGKRWDDIVANTEPLAGEVHRDMDEMATIMYTSGSTGKPKGVMQSFRAFNICASLMREDIPVDESDRMLSYLPLAHAAERIIVQNQSTYFGFAVFFAESLDTFVADLRRARPTLFFSVPRLWTKFYLGVCEKLPLQKQKRLFRIPFLGRKVKRKILEQLGLQDVRFALTGSAPLSEPLVDWYRSVGLDLLEAYGMTENMAYSHLTRPGESRVGYVGRPNEGVEARIADNGEVEVKSPGQMMGYYKQPGKTAADMTEDGFLKTGDMGEIDAMGRLRITGRVKELFKTSKGKYVAPVPIENALAAHPKIEAVCVGGVNQPATFALVLLSDEAREELANGSDRDALEGELVEQMEAVNAGLDHHEQMRFLAMVSQPWTIDNGMLTPTLKIKRNVIESHYQPSLDDWYARGEKIVWEQ